MRLVVAWSNPAGGSQTASTSPVFSQVVGFLKKNLILLCLSASNLQDNVNVFLKACGKLGLNESQLFHPGDLQDLSTRVTVRYHSSLTRSVMLTRRSQGAHVAAEQDASVKVSGRLCKVVLYVIRCTVHSLSIVYSCCYCM